MRGSCNCSSTDIGKVEQDGDIRVADRKKDIVVSSSDDKRPKHCRFKFALPK